MQMKNVDKSESYNFIHFVFVVLKKYTKHMGKQNQTHDLY